MNQVPNPPWRTSRKPIKPQLSQELIVETGLRIMDAEGLDGLSMRRVAQELDTGPASLYAHVANKEELLELIYEQVLGEIRLPEPDASRWQEQLREFAKESHRVLSSHADVARVALANIPTGPNGLRLGEFLIGLLISAGMSPRDASLGMDRLSLYVSSDAYEGSLHYAKMHASGVPTQEEYVDDLIQRIRDYYHSLPADQFPNMTAHVDELVSADSDERFDYGIELIIAGLEARLATRL